MSRAPWLSERSRHGGFDEVPLRDSPGRLFLCGKHFIGPDPESALARVDATTAVCLTEAHELEHRYPEYVAWLRANLGGRAVWHPIPDLHAPALDDAVALLRELWRRLHTGDRLLVHCGAGIGRAGTVAAALLVLDGVALADALRSVADSRPMAGPEAGAQRELLDALAAHYGER